MSKQCLPSMHGECKNLPLLAHPAGMRVSSFFFSARTREEMRSESKDERSKSRKACSKTFYASLVLGGRPRMELSRRDPPRSISQSTSRVARRREGKPFFAAFGTNRYPTHTRRVDKTAGELTRVTPTQKLYFTKAQVAKLF